MKRVCLSFDQEMDERLVFDHDRHATEWEQTGDFRVSLSPQDDWNLEKKLSNLAVYTDTARRKGLERVLRINHLHTLLLGVLHRLDRSLEELDNDLSTRLTG